MKIQLESRERHAPAQLACVVCRQTFKTPPIRALLYSDQTLLQGDLCPRCVKQPAKVIRQRLQHRAQFLASQTRLGLTQPPAEQQLARDWQAIAQEQLKRPHPLQWWLKTMQITATELRELEQARLGLSACHCGDRQRLETLFNQDAEKPNN